MKKNIVNLLCLLIVVTVCRTFCFEESNKDKVNEEMNQWLKGKKVVSTTSDSEGGWGFGNRRTCITIIAEVEE